MQAFGFQRQDFCTNQYDQFQCSSCDSLRTIFLSFICHKQIMQMRFGRSFLVSCLCLFSLLSHFEFSSQSNRFRRPALRPGHNPASVAYGSSSYRNGKILPFRHQPVATPSMKGYYPLSCQPVQQSLQLRRHRTDCSSRRTEQKR